MLECSSGSARKWAMTGVLFVFLSVLAGIFISDNYFKGALKNHIAVVRLAGTILEPVMIFDSIGNEFSCPVRRCTYDNWRNDLGKKVEVLIGEDSQVYGVVVGGIIKFNQADLKKEALWR